MLNNVFFYAVFKLLPNLNGNMNDCGFLSAKIQIIL